MTYSNLYFLIHIFIFYFIFYRSSKEELKCAESIFLNSDKGKIIISTLRSKKNLISDLLWQWKIIVPFSTNILNEKFLELEKIILTLGNKDLNLNQLK